MVTRPSNQSPRRKVNAGFKPLTQHLRPTQRRIGGKRGFHDHHIITRWRELVGDDIARMAVPHAVKSRRDGRATLVINCLSAHASEMRMRTDEIAMRLNARLGVAAIGRVEIRHQAIGFAEPRAPFTPPHQQAKTPPHVPVDIRQNITKTRDDALRDALEALSNSFYQRQGR